MEICEKHYNSVEFAPKITGSGQELERSAAQSDFI